MEKVSGVYLITNIVNGKVYVGSSIDLHSRVRRHKTNLLNRKHCNPYLQAAFDCYGEESFSFDIAEVVHDINSLLDVEQRWIDACRAAERSYGYNLLPNTRNRLGSVQSKETREKISETCRGRSKSKETCARISESNCGKVMSIESRKKMSDKAKLRVGEKHNRFGKVHSEQSKQKISESLRGAHCGEKHPRCQITELQALSILSLISRGERISDIAKEHGVPYTTVSNIKRGRSWRHLRRGAIVENG